MFRRCIFEFIEYVKDCKVLTAIRPFFGPFPAQLKNPLSANISTQNSLNTKPALAYSARLICFVDR